VPSPELIIYPARRVRTMDPARPVADAVAVRGDRVRAVGTLDELAAYGPARIDDRYVDRVIFPGMVEAHTHVGSGGVWRNPYVGYFGRTDPDGRRWEGCTSLSAVIARLRELEAKLAPGQPLVAWGLDPIYFPDERLDKRHLDAVSATRLIAVYHVSGHLMTVNSAVLAADGITSQTRVDGVARGADGEPNGELQEMAAMGLVASVPHPLAAIDTDQEFALRNFGADARNHGITTAVDLGNLRLMDDAAVTMLRDIVEDPDFPVRLSVFHFGAGFGPQVPLDDAVERITRLRATSTAKLRLGHVKLILDGSNQGFTGRLQEPGYLPDGRQGIWVIPPDQFREVFAAYHASGATIHVHCNGDEATELFLDVLEDVLERHPRWDHRHTVTHSQLSTAAQYRRMAALGAGANIFANHIYYWGDQHRDVILGPDRAARMNAAATALRCGVPIALHCDTPVTPLDPLATASYAAERRTPTGAVLGEFERISVPQALEAMTLGAAYLLKLDHLVGSIEAGKFADFAILSDDPYESSPAGLRDIEVAGTVVGGRHHPIAHAAG